MNRRLLITGAGGFLGSRICEYFNGKDGYRVVGMTRRELNVKDFVVVSAFVKAIRPDYVLHCAAISNTGACERNPVLSEKVSVRRTVNLARACGETGSRMIFTSSDQICNTFHSLEPNREGSEGKPRNVYGRDKKQTEGAMLTYLPDAVALRLTWLYDAPSRGRVAGQGFLQKLVDALKERREAGFPIHGYRGITYVWEVVRHLGEAMGLPGSVYNFGSENRYNTSNTARPFLRELAGGDFGSVLKYDSERFASYPRNLTMNTDKVRSRGMRFFNTSEGVRKCRLRHREVPQAWCQETMERTHYMNRRNILPRAVRVCGLTLLCLVVMFGATAANRARGGERLVSEYTVQDEALPRYVKFEPMPAGIPQVTAAWFYKYKGLGQLRRLLSGRAASSPEFLLWAGKPGCGRDGKYLSWA